MFVIGVTGGIGSGKSTVAGILGSWGFPVLDADKVSHEVTAPGGAALPQLVEAFGGRILDQHGALKRDVLADLIFSDHAARDLVNRIVHTEVLHAMGEQMDALSKKKIKCVVLDVPIPVREGFLDRAHFVIVVTAPDALRIERLRRRGLGEADATRRMAVQMPQEDYVRLSDLEIKNDGDLTDLTKAVIAGVLPELQKRGVNPVLPKESDIEAE